MRDHDGSILVMLDLKSDPLVPLVYLHHRLSTRNANGKVCEGCDYVHDKRAPADERRPMYESIALHHIDGFGDWLNWCQYCTDAAADGDNAGDASIHWYTGLYGNSPAVEISTSTTRPRKVRG